MPSKEHFEIPRQRQTRPKGLPWVILQEQPFHLFCRETVNIISINLSEVYHKCCILNGCTSRYLFCDIVSSLIVCSCKQNKTKAAACLVVQFWMTSTFILRQLGYSLSITMYEIYL